MLNSYRYWITAVVVVWMRLFSAFVLRSQRHKHLS